MVGFQYIDNKWQHTTMCIVHKGFRGFRAVSPASSLGGCLIGLKPAIPYDTIHSTLAVIKMKNILEKTYYLFHSITLHSEKKFQATLSVALGATLLTDVIDSFLFLFDIKSVITSSKLIMGIVFVLWSVFFYYYYRYNYRDDKILDKYKNIEKAEKNKIIIIVISIYSTLILSFIGSGIIEKSYF